MCIKVRIIAPRENLSPRMSSHCVICFFRPKRIIIIIFVNLMCAVWVGQNPAQNNRAIKWTTCLPPYLYKCRHRETIQNNWNIPQYDPSISHRRLQVGFQCSFSKLVYQFGFNPSIGGSSSSLSVHTMKKVASFYCCVFNKKKRASFFYCLACRVKRTRW